LSAKPALPVSARPHINRLFRICFTPRIKLTGHDTNEPKREFLENGENREIRKIKEQKQKCKKKKLPQLPTKRKKGQKNKNREQTAQAQANPEQTPKQNQCEEA